MAHIHFPEYYGPLANRGRYDPIAEAREAIESKIAVSETVRALEALTDEQLADIGIARADIRLVVRKAFQNPGVDYRAIEIR